jgi:hypothetical protein
MISRFRKKKFTSIMRLAILVFDEDLNLIADYQGVCVVGITTVLGLASFPVQDVDRSVLIAGNA